MPLKSQTQQHWLEIKLDTNRKTCIASGCILTLLAKRSLHVCFKGMCVDQAPSLIFHYLSTTKNKNIQMQKQSWGQLVEFDSRITFMHVTQIPSQKEKLYWELRNVPSSFVLCTSIPCLIWTNSGPIFNM